MAASELAMCVLAFSCVVDVTASEVSSIRTDRYKCTQSCVLSSNYTDPVIYKVVSRMKCAEECSKLPWCTMYSVNKDGGTNISSVAVRASCQLYMDASSACFATTWAAANTPVCIKETGDDDSVSTRCAMTYQTVLAVEDSTPDFLVNSAYLRNLLLLGFKFGIKFLSGTSNYLVKASQVRMGVEYSREICISILSYMSNGSFGITVQSFCNNGSRTPNDSFSSDPFYWVVEIPQSGKMTSNVNIYRTGGDQSALISSIEAGADFTLLFVTDNLLVHADVVLMKDSTKISVQSRIRDNGQTNLLSHLINGSTDVLTWDPSTSAISGPSSESLETIWLSSSCWQMVNNSSGNSKPPTDLITAVESGRRIRLRISIKELVILAAADYVQIDYPSGMVSAFLLRVLVQKLFPLEDVIGLVTDVLGGTSPSPTRWTHYLVTSDNKTAIFTTTVGSSEGTFTSVTANVEWFEEVGNWELVHSSNPKNLTSLALLAAKVVSGSEVRVKVQVGSIHKWFSCDTIEVSDKGQDVKCHISSHVSANINGSNSILSMVTTAATGSKPCTIKSECFIVAAAELSTAVTIPCLWPSKDALGNPLTPGNVDWFVSK